MPADNRLRLDDHQGIQNARCNPVEGRKNEAIEIAKNKPLWRFSSQHVELVAQRQDLASSEPLDRNSPMTANQISLRMSPMKRSIARFTALR
jgi:hypothetical protein